MKDRMKQAYMQTACIFAKLSYAKRLNVGCVVVKDDKIISIGYNGTPSGESNVCEDDDGRTKDCVSHAEENALTKICASTYSSEGASVFITHAPCVSCAKLIANCKIKEVFYLHDYRSFDGVEYLKKRNVLIEKISIGE